MKNLIKVFSAFVIALLFNLNIAKGQTWTHYTTADGLASNNIFSVAVDSNNIIWLGSEWNGVSKFDGSNWTTYTEVDGLADDTVVYAITIEDQNIKWFGTNGGVSRYDDVDWITYTENDGLINNCVMSIAIDEQGNKWFGTNGGVSMFDDVNWTNYTAANGLAGYTVYSIAIDVEGNKWFGTDGGVSCFDGTNWTTYTMADGLGSNHVLAVAIDAQGNKWFGTDIGLSNITVITKFDGISWTNYTIASGINWVYSIAIDLENNKWIGKMTGGVTKLNDLYLSNYNFSDEVRAIAIDVNGNKWFGTLGFGVYKFSDNGSGPLSSACIIQGAIFYDSNQNGILDNGETKLPGKMVEVLNNSTFSTTQSNGNFYIAHDSGSYQIKCIANNYWRFSTDSIITVNVSDTSTSIDHINFGIYLIEPVKDVTVDITGNEARTGFTVPYWLTYKNEASVTQSGTVVLTIDPLTTFVSSTPPPDMQNGNVITWNYSNLVPFEQRQVQLFLHMPDVSNLGDSLTTTAIINPIPGDVLTANNYDTLHQLITGSYDPNDKCVDKGIKEQGYTFMDEELTYTVRFQNTGNDTAFTVQIRDTIDSNMDMQTLRIISSSHNVRLDVKNQNVVTFIFENILLPDSGANEEASNGFIKFALKPKPGLPEYTIVTNTAYIYFDFNPAVITNQVVNTYVGQPYSDIETSLIDALYLNIFPNPARNFLTIETNQSSQIEIMNLQGQTIKQIYSDEELTNIDVSYFPAGLYFIKVTSANGFTVRKFIKE